MSEKECISQAQSCPVRFLRWSGVKELVPLSRSRIHQMVAEGTFPAPVKLGGRSSAWLESEVLSWIESRVAASRPAIEVSNDRA